MENMSGSTGKIFGAGVLIVLVMLLLPGWRHNKHIGLVGWASAGESWHVAPRIDVNVRAGKGLSYKIIAVLKENTPVEFIEEKESWAHIRLTDGKEGWMLMRYLASGTPPAEAVADLQDTATKLQQKIEDLQKQLARMTADYAQNKEQLKSVTEDRDNIKAAYDKILKDSANVLNITEQLKNTIEKIQKLKQRLSVAEEENEQLHRSGKIRWFMAGSGIIFLGWFIGLLSGRNRRRKPSLF